MCYVKFHPPNTPTVILNDVKNTDNYGEALQHICLLLIAWQAWHSLAYMLQHLRTSTRIYKRGDVCAEKSTDSTRVRWSDLNDGVDVCITDLFAGPPLSLKLR